MPQNHAPDLLVLFVAVLALIFRPDLAAVLAPYAVIIMGALLGTGWGLKRRAPGSGPAAWFVLLMLGTAFIFTMPAAVWLQRYTGDGTYQWFLAPIAALIGAIGDDWPKVGAWCARLGRRIIGRKLSGE